MVDMSKDQNQMYWEIWRGQDFNDLGHDDDLICTKLASFHYVDDAIKWMTFQFSNEKEIAPYYDRVIIVKKGTSLDDIVDNMTTSFDEYNSKWKWSLR